MKNIIFGNRYLNIFAMATVFMTLSLIVNAHVAFGLDNTNLGLTRDLDKSLQLNLNMNLNRNLKIDLNHDLKLNPENLLTRKTQLDLSKLDHTLHLDLSKKLVHNLLLNSGDSDKLSLNLDTKQDKLLLDLHENLESNLHLNANAVVNHLRLHLDKGFSSVLLLNSKNLHSPDLVLSDLQKTTLKLNSLDILHKA